MSDQAKSLCAGFGSEDRDKLDEYLTSVRELEQRMVNDESWAKKPKPKVSVRPPKDIANAADIIGRTNLLFDLAHLALQTDSTRLITIMLAGSTFAPPIQGVSLGHHDLSHHGKDPGKLAQLKIVETEVMKTVASLLAKLKQSKKDDSTLLDRTTVSSAAISATRAVIRRRICPCSSPVAAFSMASTSPSTPTARRRSAIST